MTTKLSPPKPHPCRKCGADCLATASGWCCTACSARLEPFAPTARLVVSGEQRNDYTTDRLLRKVCEECGGTGSIPCEECFGDGYTECEHCGSEVDCEACDGEGKTDCEMCNGEGFVDE